MPGAKSNGTRARAGLASLPGWDRLRHGGLLLDGTRLAALARQPPAPLDGWTERQLRQRASAMLDGGAEASPFVAFVLEQVCGLDASTGAWTRGSHVAPAWGRRAVTGETVKPRHLWQGRCGARLPVFMDDGKQLGIGRSRRIVSRVLAWLRAGRDHLALMTNGRQWRLVFAGLDYDAWCEWDLDLWFEKGELSPQVTALRTLLQGALWTPEAEGTEPPLLQAIRDTRKGQAELSEVLGERVREAVEILIRTHGEDLSSLGEADDIQEYVEYLADDAGAPAPDVDDIREMFGATPPDIYRAACRVTMRLVVILFAESRDLLPRDNPLYHESYGLHGLLERLERAAARGGNLAGSFGAWPRVLALFALVREGSHHPDLPVTAYGGDLFAPGTVDADDGVSRALRVYENACFEHEVMPDRDVHELLKLLTRTTIRIRQGRSSVRAVAPVDFSDLSSEYIGILYEGLLDYELKTAPAGDPVIFLSVGDQPALPLSRLEAMDDPALRTLFEKLKEKSSGTDDLPEEQAVESEASDLEDDTADAAASDEESLPSDSADASPSSDAPSEHVPVAPDERQRSRTRAEEWARRAVHAARLLKKPRSRETPERRLAFESRLAAKARQLVARVVLPGEWYLVRWGGTRKGSGSFYTRPGLAVPTVQRTLRPLAYDPPAAADGKPDVDAPPARWIPKPPERILDLTVCDPACGSGTFPLAALRFLTDALYAALQRHDRLQPHGDRVLVRLLGIRGANNNDADGSRLADELIPCRPDDDSFEPRLKAILRRHVVERCIYAVDLDPLAVELCRLSLWIETMDRTLPFRFLDHKIKCGNALIGVWFDQFAHYPVMAWKNREEGDKNHSNGVHFEQNARTKVIKRFVRETLTPDLRRFLRGADLFSPDLLEQSATVHDGALAVLEHMHAMPVHDAAERARLYRDELVGSAAWRALKDAMDLWCACWFWPADAIEHAPLPSTLADPPAATRAVARRIAAEIRFFHWELEFPDVFRQAGSGFDAMLGNPPWDIAKPASKEFFSNLDPLYRSYGKQQALDKQTEYFADAGAERAWLDYSARFRAQSNFMSHARSPFGDPKKNTVSQDRFAVARGATNLELHERWRRARTHSAGFADPVHPFRHQGSADLNLYKLFLETAHALLKQRTPSADAANTAGEGTGDANTRGGRLGFLLPSGLYSDHGTSALRDLFLERCRWEWLFGVENREKIFPIHRSYKFNPVVVEKGGTTEAIRTAFMRRNPDDWERAEEFATPYTVAQVRQFSPKSRALLEIQSKRDLELLEKIYANAVLLGDNGPDGWGIRYATEFHMTNDSRLFSPRPQWEAKGYQPDEYSRWLLGNWRPIGDLWKELGIAPSRSGNTEIELEDWLFDATAGPQRRQAEARFMCGLWLKPGDVARSKWRSRCAKPPYDCLPIPRTQVPAGIVLSRAGDAWVREEQIDDVALPLYEGRMVNYFDWSEKEWIRGRGRAAEWQAIPWNAKYLRPQYLIKRENATTCCNSSGPKLGFLSIGSGTNSRSFCCAVVPDLPCGNSVGTLQIEGNTTRLLELQWRLASFVFDYVVRLRLTGVNLNAFVIEECPITVSKPNARELVVCPENDFTLLDFVEDGVDSGAPHERLRVRVVVPQVVFDGHDQFLHAAKDAAPKALLRQLAEPALDQVEPRGAGRREVQLKARMGGQPVAHRLVLVGPVVVEDDVQGQIGRERAVEAPQELQEFLMPMTAVALADDLAGQHVQRGEQRRCAVTLVVVGHRAAAAGLHRQARLRAVESLNLALLVDTQHDGLVRRVQVQPHDVGQLLGERRVGRQLEGLDAVGLQAVRVPDALDRRAADAGCLGHRAAAPVGGARRRLVQRRMHDSLDLMLGDPRFPTAAGADRSHRVEAIGQEPRSPLQQRWPADTERSRDASIRDAVTGHQQGFGGRHHAIRRGCAVRPLRQGIPVAVTQQQRGGGMAHTAGILRGTHTINTF